MTGEPPTRNTIALPKVKFSADLLPKCYINSSLVSAA